MNNKEEIEKVISSCTESLIKLVNINCWNKISNNYRYILSYENEYEGENFYEIRKKRKLGNDRKEGFRINDIAKRLSLFSNDIYALNFYIYQSFSYKTTIEIEYRLKSSFNETFFSDIKENKSQVHCKVALPPYLKGKSKKFDVNWEHGNFKLWWYIFSLRLRRRLIGFKKQ